MNPSLSIYAALASNVYTQKGDPSSSVFQVPDGWAPVTNSAIVALAKSAGAKVYASADGSQFVIAFAGTDNPNTPVNDWLQNITIGLGSTAASTQFSSGVALYQAVESIYQTSQITFTGHSLGGGIASLLALVFNKSATVFDAAPFSQSVTPATAAQALTILDTTGYTVSAADLRAIANFSSFALGLGSSITSHTTASLDALASATGFANSLANISSYAENGEVLQLFRLVGGIQDGENDSDSISPGNNLTVTQLHSMGLLGACICSPSLLNGLKALPQAAGILLNTTGWLNDVELQGGASTPLDLFVSQEELSGGYPLLNSLGSDLLTISQMSASPGLQTLLIELATEYHLEQYNAKISGSPLFPAQASGSISLAVDRQLLICSTLSPLLQDATGSGLTAGYGEIYQKFAGLSGSTATFTILSGSSQSALASAAEAAGPSGAAVRFALSNFATIAISGVGSLNSPQGLSGYFWNDRAGMWLAEQGIATGTAAQTAYQYDLDGGSQLAYGPSDGSLPQYTVVFGSATESKVTALVSGAGSAKVYAGASGQTLVGAISGTTSFYPLAGDTISDPDKLGTLYLPFQIASSTGNPSTGSMTFTGTNGQKVTILNWFVPGNIPMQGGIVSQGGYYGTTTLSADGATQEALYQTATANGQTLSTPG